MMMMINNGNQPKQMDNLKNVNQYAESTKSLTFLPIVHERQTQRMKTRSEWFLKSSKGYFFFLTIFTFEML